MAVADEIKLSLAVAGVKLCVRRSRPKIQCWSVELLIAAAVDKRRIGACALIAFQFVFVLDHPCECDRNFMVGGVGCYRWSKLWRTNNKLVQLGVS